MARIYLSASFPRRDEMRGVRDILVHGMGHTVTSRWIDQQETALGTDNLSVRDGSELARRDIEDIIHSTCFMMFTGDTGTRGGRHTEFGFWLANLSLVPVFGLETIVVGPLENPFQGFDFVRHYDSWFSASVALWSAYNQNLKYIKSMEN